MLGVTPVGILTDSPVESRCFYTKTLGLEQVYPLSHINTDTEITPEVVLRLESPQIELMTVQTKLFRKNGPVTVNENTRLIIHSRDTGKLLERLTLYGTELERTTRGNFSFTDLNGINWEISRNEMTF
ncbi:MAG: VOC family protein [Candidatus Riflebacteria bacterium]|nr:VOC family protein [Candidatus Riflebacteria bacterium]